MPKECTDPTRTHGTGFTHDPTSFRETHPSYAVIGYNVVNSSGTYLAGSDVRHQSYITIRVQECDVQRDLRRDWPHAKNRIVEVHMTHAQFAQFITTPNMGNGARCTLEYVEGRGTIPAPTVQSRYQEHTTETKNAIAKSLADVNVAERALDEAIKSGKIGAIKKAHRDLQIRLGHVPSNVEFAQQSLNEFTEKVVSNAKTEVEATLNGAVRRLGLEAIAQGAALPELEA